MDDQRPLPRQGLEQPAHGPGDVARGGRADAEADCLCERERRFLAPLGPCQQRDHLSSARSADTVSSTPVACCSRSRSGQ